jgi:P27 family predicted phage terminase small subunit
MRKSVKEHLLTGVEPRWTTPTESTIEGGKPRIPETVKADADALGEWKRISRLLRERGTLTRGDAPILEVYVLTYSKFLAVRREIAAKGFFVDTPILDSTGTVHFSRKLNPAVKIESECVIQLRQLLVHFSLTPASREKTKQAKTPQEELPFPPGSVGWLLEQRKQEKLEMERSENEQTNDASSCE